MSLISGNGDAIRLSRKATGALVMLSVLAASGVFLKKACGSSEPSDPGRFIGVVATKWITPDREMELLEDFAYVDPFGKQWDAPKGSIIDGASIPRALWTIVGSPFTGLYRNASVVHDVACSVMEQPWRDVHRMFYYAMRRGGVDEQSAKLMYGAVYHFGPRWEVCINCAVTLVVTPTTEPSKTQLDELTRFLGDNPSLDEIEQLRIR